MSRIVTVVVTGSQGMVGTAVQHISKNIEEVIALTPSDTIEVVRRIKPIFKFVFLDRKTVDLTNKDKVFECIRTIKPDIVIHLAAKVGGLFANQKDNEGFYFQNLHMSENLLQACNKFGVKYTFSFLSTCIYPQDPSLLPYKEENLHKGEPHPSNYGYAFAKRQHEVMCRIYNQAGGNHVCLIPNNLYGPNDNFDLNNAHVIPAIISKTFTAIQENKQLSLPGSGKGQREFTYVHDIARQLLAYMIQYVYGLGIKPTLVNLGNNEEVTIKEVTIKICDTFEQMGHQIPFDKEQIFSKEKFNQEYDGIFRKPSSLELLHSVLPKTKNPTTINSGIIDTINWYLNERNR